MLCMTSFLTLGLLYSHSTLLDVSQQAYMLLRLQCSPHSDLTMVPLWGIMSLDIGGRLGGGGGGTCSSTILK